MNTTVAIAVELAVAINEGISVATGTVVVVCPPFVSLVAVADALRGSEVAVGAQNMHAKTSGAYTGEISPEMLSQICRYVILGHSERRTHFSESDEFVNAKFLAAQEAGITPILCVGESLVEHREGRAGDVVVSQLDSGLKGANRQDPFIVAYEPAWAIGAGQSASPEIAQDIMAHLRETLSCVIGERSLDIPLLYGGSVNSSNIESFVAQQDIDGALVGGASLEAESFCRIAALASNFLS